MGGADMRRRAPDEEIAALYARLDDLCGQAEQGLLVATPFLTPREARYARQYLSARLRAGTAALWGGYPEAERVRVMIFPDYVEGLLPEQPTDGGGVSPSLRLREAGLDDLADQAAEMTAALSIYGSGYRILSHRDYMGAVLGLGLERDTLGDILPDEEGKCALLFCTDRVSRFLSENLEKVGSDTVRLCRLNPEEVVIPPRRVRPVQDTVASERLDCVVAALCGLSREPAQALIRQGLCDLEYETVRDCDHLVEPPAVLSVRGHGKFRILPFGGENRRGRLRLLAEKYI